MGQMAAVEGGTRWGVEQQQRFRHSVFVGPAVGQAAGPTVGQAIQRDADESTYMDPKFNKDLSTTAEGSKCHRALAAAKRLCKPRQTDSRCDQSMKRFHRTEEKHTGRQSC